MSDLIDQIDKTKVPKHIAIIMDGNGRWARQKGLDRSAGHKEGISALHRTLEAANEIGVKYVTVYTFSTENWNRPQEEVDALMGLVSYSVRLETPTLVSSGTRLECIGDLSRLPKAALESIEYCKRETAKGTAATLILALNYSSRWEITKAAQDLARKAANGEIRPEDIDADMFSQHLATANYPEPDLLIRTGGEQRISNYLLWQISYSELYFCDTFWPDFGRDELFKAVIEYQNRERRFGKTSAQIQAEQV